ncbi:MAG: pyridoxal phosphate-dependent aminotransferase [Oscillospiraceae bacterium]|nr:pyridoxal phosphate-dependent aminotransferase [Oscillospiraceae bacterium]
MQYCFDTYVDRSNNNSAKYDELERVFGTKDVLPLWVADMDFKTCQPVIDALKARAEQGIFGYVSRPDDYFPSVQRWQQRRNGWSPDCGLMSWCCGVNPASASMLKIFCKPGDKLLLLTPVYGDFFDAADCAEMEVVESMMVERDGKWTVDWDDLEEKMQQVQAFLFCNPHNPMGIVWTKEELRRFGTLAMQNHVLLISDEIHSDLIFHGKTFTNMAMVSPELAKYVITCTSASKTFNLAGLQCATIIFPNRESKQRFDHFWASMDVHRNNAFSVVANLVAMNEGEPWLAQLLPYLSDNFDYIDRFLKENIPEIKAIVPDATYLVWLDCRGLGMENQDELVQFMIQKAKLGLNDGRFFSKKFTGFMRLNAAAPRSTLEKAMNQLLCAVQQLRASRS